MLNRIKKAAAVLAVAATLALTAGTGAQLATAANSPAEAATFLKVEKWQFDRYVSGGRAYCGVWALVDYNWWEETFQGKRDGWERQYYAYC